LVSPVLPPIRKNYNLLILRDLRKLLIAVP
jgi:hypothetical protein